MGTSVTPPSVAPLPPSSSGLLGRQNHPLVITPSWVLLSPSCSGESKCDRDLGCINFKTHMRKKPGRGQWHTMDLG